MDGSATGAGAEPEFLLRLEVSFEQDVFTLRRQAKAAAQAAGMETRDQVRLATALSELGRDLLRADSPMSAEFLLTGGQGALVVALAWPGDRMPSQESLDAVARLLPQVGCAPERGRLTIACPLSREPGAGAGPVRAERIRQALRSGAGASLTEDLRAQTRDLVAALDESRRQGEELQRLNAELEETNQGVVALYSELTEELETTNRGVLELYAELDEKSRQLREASESKTRFWSNVSHELRTPINSVIGLTRLMLDPGSDPLTAEQQRQVALVGAAGNILLTLVDELLDVAKAEAGRMEPQPVPVDLRALLVQLRGIMTATAVQPGVRLLFPDLDAPGSPDLPDLPDLVTDEVMLARILRNLLSNGLKFTLRGEVRLDVRRESEQWLTFTVTDTGVGIPEDQLEKVFEEFYQVKGAHQRNRPGTGLGLPYARRLAALIGGTLTLDSRLGEGTRVVLRLPVGERPAAADDAAPRPLASVLSADDDPVFREAFRPVLKRLAERVVELDDGRQVVSSARREQPEAVLLDLCMPGADIRSVLDGLAGDPALRHIPVIIITSTDPSSVDLRGLGHARAVLGKDGLTAERLADLVAAATGERKHHHEHP
ncbi:response regulator [Streptacidiphilus sp. PB12-B1b]|uniref:ATP-binding response regulator n=1 Tax=Streptacidiphilus sp. PB12-B1b TaxID=2705012 RepID=UPI0015FD79C4|nr:ATP-binding protein [Streptacidiphilus sp. PB12-B1b]QMU77066.1 response regulator [Streptacidiphilus sp. PB12-B1b]